MYLERQDIQMEIASWMSGIDSEVLFWEKFFFTKGCIWPEDYMERISGEHFFTYPQLLPNSDIIHVLDVGAGPISLLGNKPPKEIETTINLTACDPLAAIYSALLRKYKIIPYVSTEFAFSERLCDRYASNFFDIVHIQNALDHSIMPLLGIENMLSVCKIGGKIILSHTENEAEFEQYIGLHQWNITMINNKLVFWNKKNSINVSDILNSKSVIEVRKTANDNGTYNILAILTKTAEIDIISTHMNNFDDLLVQVLYRVASPAYCKLDDSGPAMQFFRNLRWRKLRRLKWYLSDQVKKIGNKLTFWKQ